MTMIERLIKYQYVQRKKNNFYFLTYEWAMPNIKGNKSLMIHQNTQSHRRRIDFLNNSPNEKLSIPKSPCLDLQLAATFLLKYPTCDQKKKTENL